jgi:hypothetical protein
MDRTNNFQVVEWNEHMNFGGVPLLQPSTWEKIRHTDDGEMVTTPPPKDITPVKKRTIEDMMK